MSLLFLVLLHKLLEHLLGRLLALLPYILLDQLVHTAQFLNTAALVANRLSTIIRFTRGSLMTIDIICSIAILALASLGSFLRSLIPSRAIAIDKGLLDEAVKLGLVCFAREDASQVVILVTLQRRLVDILADLGPT